jgi:hypothetical protein
MPQQNNQQQSASNNNQEQPTSNNNQQRLSNIERPLGILSDLTTVVQAVVQALVWLTLSASVQTHPATQPSDTPIQQQADQTITLLENLQATINQLNESDDNETLHKVMDAISELRQLILKKTNELNQSKQQLLAHSNAPLSNTQQFQEQKADLESNIVQLESQIPKLKAIEERIKASEEAINWLNPDTKQDFLVALAKDAGDAAFKADPILKNPGEAAESLDNILLFYSDIKQFLFLIHRCLIVCRPNLLDRAITEDKLPRSPLPATAYAKAFEYIRDNSVPRAVPHRAAIELIKYLNYLIDKFNSNP